MQGTGAQEAQQTLHVPNAYVGAVIGTKGAKIAELQRVSQARIVIENEQNDPRVISVSGSALAVAGAVSMLNDVLDAEKLRVAGGGAAVRPPGVHTVEIVAQGSKCGVVIGRGGENIRELQERSGARVQVSREPDAENCRTITISGTEVQVAVARRRVDELLQHGDAPPPSQPSHAAQQPLPPHYPQAAQQPHYPMYPTPPPGPPPPLPFPPPAAGAAGGAEPELEVEVELQASSQALQMLLSTPAMQQQLHASLGAGVRAHVRPERDAAGLRPVRLSGDAARVHGVKLLVQACEVRRGHLAALTHLHARPPHAPSPTLPSAAVLAPLHPSRAPLTRGVGGATQAHARAARERPERLSASEALHAYYGPFYEAAGLPYVEPRRLWHDEVRRPPPLAPTLTLAPTATLASTLLLPLAPTLTLTPYGASRSMPRQRASSSGKTITHPWGCPCPSHLRRRRLPLPLPLPPAPRTPRTLRTPRRRRCCLRVGRSCATRAAAPTTATRRA